MKFLKALMSLIIVVAVLGAGLAGGGWIWLQNEIVKSGPGATETAFAVQSGETLASVATRLEADGFIRNAAVMRIKARLDGTEQAVKSGEFVLTPQMSVAAIMELLVEGKAIQHKLTLPEGRTTAQLLKMVEDNAVLIGDMPTEPIAEGSLLPDTYFFHRGVTRAELIADMQAAQTKLLDDIWSKRQADLPIATPAEAIILASVVEKETGRVDEQPQIAGLFVTRLKRGMRLESDPTIIYGISKGEPLFNKNGERRTLTRSEIDRKTAWNTYQIDGLPKTPICNPGRGAIEAVLQPDETGYIFFVADGKGGHLFGKTLQEHNANVAAYRAYEREEIARERAKQ
jgi:UPF0755 protein